MIKLIRYGSIPDQGTFGELTIGDWSCCTIELPWRDNKPNQSCVPQGYYDLVPHSSRSHPETWALVGETVSHFPPGHRFAILFHPGNYMSDFNGCIGVGRERSGNGGRWMVTHSRDTFNEFLSHIRGEDKHSLIIKWLNPEKPYLA